jgi:hypothetical protein
MFGSDNMTDDASKRSEISSKAGDELDRVDSRVEGNLDSDYYLVGVENVAEELAAIAAMTRTPNISVSLKTK